MYRIWSMAAAFRTSCQTCQRLSRFLELRPAMTTYRRKNAITSRSRCEWLPCEGLEEELQGKWISVVQQHRNNLRDEDYLEPSVRSRLVRAGLIRLLLAPVQALWLAPGIETVRDESNRGAGPVRRGRWSDEQKQATISACSLKQLARAGLTASSGR
jgi:hypothetical protein